VQQVTPQDAVASEANQVFIKLFLPIKPPAAEKGQRVVESWVAEQLKQRGESEVAAATGWVPLSNEFEMEEWGQCVSTNFWDGVMVGQSRDCPMSADICERRNQRLEVGINTYPHAIWEKLSLSDEPGSKGIFAGLQPVKDIGRPPKALYYVAVLIGPPPVVSTGGSDRDTAGSTEEAEPGVGADSR
jgi:hypothetical protein